MNIQFLLEAWRGIRDANYINVELDATYAVEREGKLLKIYFQGSHGIEDWKHNFDFPAKPYKDMICTWRVHRGFLKVWKAVEKYLEPYIKDETVRHIKIAGHSHGGALAQFCHEYCRYWRPDIKVETYAFGAPRVLFGIMPKEIKNRFKGLHLLVNGLDIVPHLPFMLLGFRNVSKIIKVGHDLNPLKSHMRYGEVLEKKLHKNKIWL